CMQAFHLPYSF
nr:immunoglobulin light chain junction region [Macaca mulatta]